jgi:hypothetical protein
LNLLSFTGAQLPDIFCFPTEKITVNNFKTVFETQINSRTNTENLVQLIEQILYRHPGYCTEMRSYLGSLQQANILSLDVYATLIAEIEQFEEKHLSITFEHWRTLPVENTVFHKHPLPMTPQLPAVQSPRLGRWLTASGATIVIVGFVVWYWQPLENLPPASLPFTESLPIIPSTTPPPVTLLAQSTPPAPPTQPVAVINTGDVEPPLPNANVTESLQTQQIEQWLKTCQQQFDAQNLTTAKSGGETAVACYRKVLTADGNNGMAKEGLVKIENLYGDWVENALKKKQVQKARVFLRALAQINPDSPRFKELQQRLATVK